MPKSRTSSGARRPRAPRRPPRIRAHSRAKRRRCMLQLLFGYTENLRLLITPRARNAVDSLGSMGTDTPTPVLSRPARACCTSTSSALAQVTNPPLDAKPVEVRSLVCRDDRRDRTSSHRRVSVPPDRSARPRDLHDDLAKLPATSIRRSGARLHTLHHSRASITVLLLFRRFCKQRTLALPPSGYLLDALVLRRTCFSSPLATLPAELAPTRRCSRPAAVHPPDPPKTRTAVGP